MKVRMKVTRKGSPNGIDIIEYQKGKTYDMADSLARPWIEQGLATAVGKKKPVAAPEDKAAEPPENKKK